MTEAEWLKLHKNCKDIRGNKIKKHCKPFGCKFEQIAGNAYTIYQCRNCGCWEGL